MDRGPGGDVRRDHPQVRRIVNLQRGAEDATAAQVRVIGKMVDGSQISALAEHVVPRKQVAGHGAQAGVVLRAAIERLMWLLEAHPPRQIFGAGINVLALLKLQAASGNGVAALVVLPRLANRIEWRWPSYEGGLILTEIAVAAAEAGLIDLARDYLVEAQALRAAGP